VRQWNKEMKEWKYVSTVKEEYNTEWNEVKKGQRHKRRGRK
jgi:hypothetical protein